MAERRGDGRTARAERTRESVVDGLLALIEEGDLAPTAQRIAERAGVSQRSIYQHFADIESLYRAASARQLERVMALHEPIPPALPTAERVERFVAQRARRLEAITPIRRAALLQEHASPELRASRDRFMALGRDQVKALFAPELDRADPAERRTLLAALHAAGSWNSWDWSRTSGLSVDAAAQVMQMTLLALLAPSR
jgi:AcrR family transcriptional regulator